MDFIKNYRESYRTFKLWWPSSFFINRRGFAPIALCKNCLKIYSCPNCSINLVYHKDKKNLLCHYCGFKSKLNKKCEKKDLCEFIFSGPGVERIAEEVKKLFPNYNSLIFSSDTMNKKSSNKIKEIKKMVLFCALGWRSALATKSLVDMGFKNVAHVDGGFDALKKSGLKVVTKEKK